MTCIKDFFFKGFKSKWTLMLAHVNWVTIFTSSSNTICDLVFSILTKLFNMIMPWHHSSMVGNLKKSHNFHYLSKLFSCFFSWGFQQNDTSNASAYRFIYFKRWPLRSISSVDCGNFISTVRTRQSLPLKTWVVTAVGQSYLQLFHLVLGLHWPWLYIFS